METLLLIIDRLISAACFFLIIAILQTADVWRRISPGINGWKEKAFRFSFTMMAGGFAWKFIMKERFQMQDYFIDGGILVALLTLWIRKNAKSSPVKFV